MEVSATKYPFFAANKELHPINHLRTEEKETRV